MLYLLFTVGMNFMGAVHKLSCKWEICFAVLARISKHQLVFQDHTVNKNAAASINFTFGPKCS